jgi:DNA-binding CsgD family transcriptional regulator
MEENRKFYATAAELFQSWTRQPFGDDQACLSENFSGDMENAFQFYSKGKQFVYVYDYKLGRIAFVSQNIRQVLGYAPEAVSGEFFYSKMHLADHDQVLNITRAAGEVALQHTEIEALMVYLTVDCRLQHADGHYIKMLRQTSILQRDEQGNIRFSLGIFTDITHLYRGDAISFDVSMPEYKAKIREILAAEDPDFVPGEFSDREKQVLRLMALGKNTRQIAQDLTLSRFTVDTHRKNMKKKLGVSNTAQLITAAISRNLI